MTIGWENSETQDPQQQLQQLLQLDITLSPLHALSIGKATEY